MRKKVFLVSIGLLLFASCVYAQQQVGGPGEEKLTITTYYPSPYGVYKTLRLFPNDDYTPGSECPNAGELYFDNSEQRVFVCSGVWQPLLGDGDLTWFGGVGVVMKRGTTASIEYQGCGGALLQGAEAKKDAIDGKIYTRVYAKPATIPQVPGVSLDEQIQPADPSCGCDSGWQLGMTAACESGCWNKISAVTTVSGVSLDAKPACCDHILYPGAENVVGPWGVSSVLSSQGCVPNKPRFPVPVTGHHCQECGHGGQQSPF